MFLDLSATPHVTDDISGPHNFCYSDAIDTKVVPLHSSVFQLLNGVSLVVLGRQTTNLTLRLNPMNN